MTLLRLLLLAAIVYLAWRLLRRFFAPVTPPQPRPEFEPMERCAQCGAHVPRTQLADGRCARCRA